MAVICICGFCIPYSTLWPILLLFLKPLFDYVQAMFGVKAKQSQDDLVSCDANSCCSLKAQKSGIFELTANDNWNALRNKPDLTFVRFTASWCAPCKKIEPAFLACGAAHSDLNFITIDVDKFDEIAASYGAVAIPMFLAIRKGEVLGKLKSNKNNELIDFVERTVTSTALTEKK
jgi:thioredoxin 1